MKLRYTAKFIPQAWINDNAIDCDAQGPDEWDCTDAMNELPAFYRDQILLEVTQLGEALDNEDQLKGDPTAPDWVRDWSGPFSIYVRDAS